MSRSNHPNHVRRWAALAALLLVAVLGLAGLAAPGGGNVALATSPGAGDSGTGSVTAPQWQTPGRPLRRESGPTTFGPAPRTGAPSVFRPLDDPVFGTNVRANTDTQSPNRAQQEPSIAVNPTNPLNVVAAAKDERAGTNTKQDWIYTSTDGGTTWINQQFPLNPSSTFSSDPVVKFADDGWLFVTALPYGGSSGDGIQTARSTDGGITFSPGVKVPGSGSNSDKEWTWIDNFPASPFYHYVYVAYMDPPGSTVRFSRSTDRGVTWSPAQTIASGWQFPMPIVYPNGNIQTIYVTGSSTVSKRSTDGGVTWGAQQPVASYFDANCPPDNSGCSIWRLNTIPVIAVDPTNGNSVVIWADGSDGTAKIKYTRSTDNGVTWSASQILANPGVPNTYQVEPWVEADENGVMHAVWYDDRMNPNTSIFNIYYSQSTDDGATWSTAIRISTATSDLRIGIPSSYALAAGDYINVTASHGNVYAAWTDTRSGTGEDIYVVRGTYGGTPTPTVTGTPPTNTPTRTATYTATATSTPCAFTQLLGETFESGTLGVFTSTVATCVPGGCGWVNTTTNPHGGTRAAFAPDATNTSDQRLTNINPVNIPAGVQSAGLTFWHLYDLESDWDGGVLEYSTNGGSTWTDAGALITAGGYNGTLNSSPNPLSGRQAWTGSNGSHSQVSVNLTSLAGQSVLFRFRLGTDTSAAATGWTVDDVVVYTASTSCGSVTPGPTNTATRTATTIATATRTNTVQPTNTLPTSTQPPTLTAIVTATNTPSATGTAVPCTINFADVPPDHTFYTWIMCLACDNVVNGYPCGGPGEPCNSNSDPYFRPGGYITRAQIAKIVALAANITDPVPPAQQTFEDVPIGSTFWTYIEQLAGVGAMQGYECGGPGEPCVAPGNRPYFRQNALATRGQLTKIVSQAAGYTDPIPAGTQTFEDVPEGSTFHEYVERLLLHNPNAMSGYDCGGPGEPCVPPQNRPYFRPANNVTRGQASKIVASIFYPSCGVGR